MWIISVLILLYFFNMQNLSVYGEVKLIMDQIPNFPVSANTLFKIGIVAEESGASVSDQLTDTMVIQIKDKDESLEKAIFDYGFKDMIDQEFKGEFMRITEWQKSGNLKSINITILFTTKAFDKLLTIYNLSPVSKERQAAFKNLNEDKLIYSAVIKLYIPPTVELLIITQDGRKGELLLDQKGIATCRSFNGVPAKLPKWVNNAGLTMDNQTTGDPYLLRSLISVTVADHLKLLSCEAGMTKTTVKIIVLHQPSQITLEPEISGRVENGTTVLCVAIDGYPPPDIRWHLVQGPPKADDYFNISRDGRKLHIKAETPQNSVWTFNCTATNVLPTSSGVFNRTVTFSVGHQPEGLFGLNLTLQIMIGVAVMGAIIVFCIVIVFIVCIARRSCANHSESRNHRRNGGPVKTAAEKKPHEPVKLISIRRVQTLEAEQVTLLPPGAPQNHLDMANAGSGLPPPPPEYQLIIDNEIKSVIPLDQQVISDAYPEVTYAELNTSDLPMKVTMYHKANKNDDQVIYTQVSYGELNKPNVNNDDQVIYSQIIGTMSTPDCAQRGPGIVGAGGGGGYLDSDNV